MLSNVNYSHLATHADGLMLRERELGLRVNLDALEDKDVKQRQNDGQSA